MKIAITGATGFVGSRLQSAMLGRGWAVTGIGRSELADPKLLKDALASADAVVNLAGAPIIARWSAKYKETLYQSRIGTTHTLVAAMKAMDKRPPLLISTSAVGIYKDGGQHTERQYTLEEGFLGQLARDWEAAAMEAEPLGLRVAIFRLGIVLGPGGGALKEMMPAFRMGLGGPMGPGTQYISWIHMEDLVQAYMKALTDSSARGIYNLTSPNPVTSREFAEALGRALKRPAFLSVPGFALRLRFGQGASVLLSGQQVLPERLLKEGFAYSYPDINSALAHCVAHWQEGK